LDALTTTTKFIISDHPVTVYNRDCFPAGEYCREHGDPEVLLVGTHTLFPLSLTRILVITNLAWVRNPYQKAIRVRPNPNPLRPSRLFSFLAIQTLRELTEQEVNQIDFIIKRRARRFIASSVEEWLYPEKKMASGHWRKLDDRYLLMPDPRSVSFSGEMLIGYKNGHSDAYDEYGRRPWEKGYANKADSDREWRTFHAFQGEHARLFGPRRRGRTLNFSRIDSAEDSADFHARHLRAEAKFMPSYVKARRGRRASS
jgi:Protein of unknown function (DUF4238)